MAFNIGLLIVATGRYVELLDSLLASARRHFFPGHRVTPFVFTDAASAIPDAVRVGIGHEPWPMVTLKRYHYFSAASALLQSQDFLFYVDVDMRFVADCGEEILPGEVERLVGVRHPGYYRRRRWWSLAREPSVSAERLPFERDPRSLACIADRSHRTYYAGGFNGGYADSFLTMARSIRDAVDLDLERGIVAVWHDESHLNRYFHVQRPKALTPAYCYPDPPYRNLRGLRPVLLALSKDHAYFRESGARAEAVGQREP